VPPRARPPSLGRGSAPTRQAARPLPPDRAIFAALGTNLPAGRLLGSKITSRGLRHPAIVTEQAAEASGPLDLAISSLHPIAGASWRS
jgi:hypothetical protein